MGNYKDAFAEFQEALKLSNGANSVRTDLAYAHAVAGEKVEAWKILREMLHEVKTKQRHHFVSIAFVYSALGQKDEAFKYLEYAYRERLPGLTHLATSRRWAPLRSDARFQNLLERVGLPPIPRDSESPTDIR